MTLSLDDISIRNHFEPGDLGMIIHMHGHIYAVENDYDIHLETYVLRGVLEFFEGYDPELDRVWICEHKNKMVGVLVLMHRENHSAQLRYFLIRKEYRSIGLGRELMEQYMGFFKQCGYRTGYLWTTNEQEAAIRLYEQHGFRLSEEKPSTAFGKPLIERRYDLDVD